VTRAPQAPPFQRSLAVSAAAHGAVAGVLLLLPHIGFEFAPPIEIEITSPYLGDGPAKLGAPKPLVKGVPEPINETPETTTPPTETKAPEPPKDWTLPGPDTKVVEAAPAPAPTPGGAEGGTGTAAKVGGSGEGSDDGVVGGTGSGGTPLLALPRLLNRDEVVSGLRRFYPESERQAGREGDVVVMLHLGVEGRVSSVDVATSAGPAFDEAARKVANIMRFSPAVGRGGQPVRVRLPQAVRFRLTD
jgi:TonB family protein